MMVNHNEFGVTEEDFQASGDDEEKVRILLFQKMKRFITRHPEAASDDSIKTLVALAVDELLLNGNLENARLLYQPVPFLKFFKQYGVKGLETRQGALAKAAEAVNGVAEVKGMLDTLKMEVGNSCKCLNLFIDGKPLNPQPVDQGLSYVESLVAPLWKIPVKRLNAMGQDSRLHVEIRRLCAPNDKPPYMCVLIAPASRYIFHSLPIEETTADLAFLHVLEAIVMAVVTEGMGMIDEAVRVRPAQLTTTDPLLARYLSPLLGDTRVSVAASSDKVINADSDAKTKETPLIAIMDGVFADFNLEVKNARKTHKLPIGDTMSEEAKWKVKSRTASGKEKFIADSAAEEREIPERMMACKGCKELKTRKEVKQCSLCSEVWYCGNECQASDWSAGHKTECSRKNEGKKNTKGAGHVSEDSGDDLRDHARSEALDTFAIDLMKKVPGGGAKKKAGGKKGKGKGKKK
eukprot:jgi/Undpi1/13121/HiC_scaffold_8.g02783.m1